MKDELLMTYIGFAIAIFVIGMGIKRLVEKFPNIVPTSEKYPIKDLLSFLVTNSEMRRRLLLTIAILAVVKIGYFIPLPTVNGDLIRQFFNNISRVSGGGSLTLYFGGAFTRLSIMGLGIMPFMSACFMVQLSSVLIPAVRKATFGGEAGRNKITRYSYILTVILSLVQSYFISLWLENPARFQGMDIVTMHGLPYHVLTVATLTGATVMLLFFANLINRHGLGNGIALIIISGILTKMVGGISQLYSMSASGKFTIIEALFLCVIFGGLLWVVFFFSHSHKNLSLKKADGQNEISVPLRVSWVAKVPYTLALSIALFPATLAALNSTPAMQNVASILRSGVISNIITGILTFFFTYLYAIVVFKPSQMIEFVGKYGYSVNATGGKEAKAYLDDIVSKYLIITAILLIVVSNIPSILMYLFKIPLAVAGMVGGTGILLLAGGFSDILNQLKFFRDKNGRDYKVAYVSFSEIEAKVQSEYLKSKGIDSLVEPLRFTWGMPIRTTIDQYRIYTPQTKIEEARKLLV